MNHNDIKNVTYLNVVKPASFSYVKQRDVFWPFFLWRVLAPKNQPALDVFQVLILKLLKAGCSSEGSICEYSNLDNVLVGKLLLDLMAADLTYGKIKGEWKITQKGRDSLKGVEAESNETMSYYLVQDALTGQLLPRVLTRLSYIDSMDFSEKYPAFIISRSSGKKSRPLLIETSKTNIEQPSVEQMSDCLRGFRRDQNKLIQKDMCVSDKQQKIKNSISLIEDEAIPVFIHLKLFSVCSGERSWYLSDPTGLTTTVPELNDIAEQVLISNKVFASSINNVLGIADKDHASDYLKQKDKFSESAKLELHSNYSWTQSHDMIREQVLGMLRIKKEVEFEKKPKQEQLRSLLSELHNVIEAWIKTILRPDKKNTEWRKLPSPKEHREDRDKLAQELYLRTEGVSTYVAQRLATVRRGSIQAALTMGNQSLKPLLSAMILKFPWVVEQLNREYSDWLDLSVQLSDDRNTKGSHANSKGEVLTKEEIMNHVESVERLLAVSEKLIGSN